MTGFLLGMLIGAAILFTLMVITGIREMRVAGPKESPKGSPKEGEVRLDPAMIETSDVGEEAIAIKRDASGKVTQTVISKGG